MMDLTCLVILCCCVPPLAGMGSLWHVHIFQETVYVPWEKVLVSFVLMGKPLMLSYKYFSPCKTEADKCKIKM